MIVIKIKCDLDDCKSDDNCDGEESDCDDCKWKHSDVDRVITIIVMVIMIKNTNCDCYDCDDNDCGDYD